MGDVFVCSECTYPSRAADHCDNPACLANPHANHAAIRERIAADQKRRAEEDARRAFRDSLRRAGFTPTF